MNTPALTTNKHLRNCIDCGGLVSRAARACPHCGRVFKRQKRGTNWFTWIVALILGWMLLGYILRLIHQLP